MFPGKFLLSKFIFWGEAPQSFLVLARSRGPGDVGPFPGVSVMAGTNLTMLLIVFNRECVRQEPTISQPQNLWSIKAAQRANEGESASVCCCQYPVLKPVSMMSGCWSGTLDRAGREPRWPGDNLQATPPHPARLDLPAPTH